MNKINNKDNLRFKHKINNKNNLKYKHKINNLTKHNN